MELRTLACLLLLAVGALGALDILLFHTLEHRLHHQPSARRELVTHALRGPTYATLFLVVPNLALSGAWFWALAGLLAFDVAISIWDFSLERTSRAPMGGLPTGEYVLHSVVAVLFGAFATCWLIGSWDGHDAPTAAAVAPAVPDAVRALFALMAVGVLGTASLDALAVRRLGRSAA